MRSHVAGAVYASVLGIPCCDRRSLSIHNADICISHETTIDDFCSIAAIAIIDGLIIALPYDETINPRKPFKIVSSIPPRKESERQQDVCTSTHHSIFWTDHKSSTTPHRTCSGLKDGGVLRELSG